MPITSNAFGHTTLTGSDAEKFNRQVTYGKPKAAAVQAVSTGREMASELNRTGSITVRIPKRDKAGL